MHGQRMVDEGQLRTTIRGGTASTRRYNSSYLNDTVHLSSSLGFKTNSTPGSCTRIETRLSWRRGQMYAPCRHESQIAVEFTEGCVPVALRVQIGGVELSWFGDPGGGRTSRTHSGRISKTRLPGGPRFRPACLVSYSFNVPKTRKKKELATPMSSAPNNESN